MRKWALILIAVGTSLIWANSIQADVLENLVARYSFDRPPEDGKLFNEVSGKYDASNMTYPKGRGATWHASDGGGFMEFSCSDYVILPKTIAGRNMFSVGAWFNAAPEGAKEIKILSGTGGYSLLLGRFDKTSSRKLKWSFVDATSDKWTPPVWSDAAAEPDQWHHVVVTYDGRTLSMYVDGVKQKSTVETVGSLKPNTREQIGTWFIGNGDQWEGCLDDIRYYDVSLTEKQVMEVFQASREALIKSVRPATNRPAERPAPPVAITWTTPPGGVDCFKLVQAYADALIERGRDFYGDKHSPLFAVALSRSTYRLAQFRGVPGIRPGDRTLTGANPMVEEDMYQVLYALTELTHDKKYAVEADKALKYFFLNCQSRVTGLMAWGEHIGWDMEDERMIGNGIHEFARPWILWNQSYAVAPEACVKFARGLWDHQISDDKKSFSRHAAWATHGPEKGNEFPRHGGFYIATWAAAYGRTHDQVYLTAIEAVVDIFRANASAASKAIASQTTTTRNMNKVAWVFSNLSLAIDVAASSGEMPPALHEKMNSLVADVDRSFLKAMHNFPVVVSDRSGFVVTADVDTLEPTTANNNESKPFTRMWEMGYGDLTDAVAANLCYQRYLQLADGPTKEAYRNLVLSSATRYLAVNPDVSRPIFPGTMGNAIWHALCAYELSGEQKYLDRAQQFAKIAVDALVTDGCPLPRASTVNDHYEAITGADTLMMSLLRLSVIQRKDKVAVKLVFTNR